ncbi:MAG: sugar phosphate isomerase/epimerase [Verrucomicrobiales bacterium]|jgi:sugar phosphate isomerase/epimerase|nr:sugar phosphate isomerase/epimerase [Verrucomicrobiales bacterium]
MAGHETIKSGLASVSLRQLNPAQLVNWCGTAALAGIEWDGETHVPHGDYATARRVGALTREHGIAIVAYSSYYRIGASERHGPDFARVLETAAHLQAPLIRVRAGIKSSADADEAYVNWIVEQSAHIAGLAAAVGIKVAYECQAGTLTDSVGSIVSLLDQARHPNLYFLWQPTAGKTVAYNLQLLRAVLPRLTNVRVFHRGPDVAARQALAAGAADWREYFNLLRQDGQPRYALLKLVKHDAPEQLQADALTLRQLLSA